MLQQGFITFIIICNLFIGVLNKSVVLWRKYDAFALLTVNEVGSVE